MQKWMTEFSQNENAVYFATADKTTQLVGLGISDEISGWTDETILNQWVQHQNSAVFGGFNFDADQALTGLMGGYFFAPEQLIDLNANSEWTASVPQVTHSSLHLVDEMDETDWTTRMQPVLTQMQIDPTKQKVVLGMQATLTFDGPIQVANLLESLVAQQPESYHFVLKRGTDVFVSATPERIVKLSGNQFETAAVAGSIRRGEDTETDTALADALWHDQKNREEHQIVVDMLVNQLADVSTLTYASTPQMLQTPQIQHLYTPIQGQLNSETALLALVERLHPTPALGGWPRDWAKSIIEDYELAPRGLFAAPLGYYLPNGTGEFIVGIRSMLVQADQARLFAGAGILAESDLAQEAQEIQLKMTPMRQLLEDQTDAK
ncbi:isochorismate synthase [Weissella viridescens]|uniref:isochorismate synthase n=1 Tax=Weissella viridescens TaxID=1629 RepID=A0A3P2RDI2_WEIVI|nr:isochorismate synthase [Weissella viridescens]RRG18819.1 isochorismate synthase [Weissella viridescens]